MRTVKPRERESWRECPNEEIERHLESVRFDVEHYTDLANHARRVVEFFEALLQERRA